ncbi:MAG: prolipoprotein diacylglyceryl transferase [Gammaproteobacteria bacterium]|nr:prolipoprotein diacylglyceryl transferase [Gammaproteobacteria bacterium]
MLQFPDIDPIAIQLGPVAIHWYGLMYLLGFSMVWFLGNNRAKKRPELGWTEEQISDLVFYGAMGVIVGGRIGYMFFYNFDSLLQNPLSLFKLWEGGMSFHGGLVAVILGMVYFGRKHKKTFLEVTDFMVPLTPIGIGAVRIANFINGELWGRVSDVPWAMVFPTGGPEPRHPSQLYESLFEGWILFAVLWWYSCIQRPTGAVSGLFLAWYGTARFTIEFFRQPDAHMGEGGFMAFQWLTMGQILSTPMILAGLWLIWRAYTKPQLATK